MLFSNIIYHGCSFPSLYSSKLLPTSLPVLIIIPSLSFFFPFFIIQTQLHGSWAKQTDKRKESEIQRRIRDPHVQTFRSPIKIPNRKPDSGACMTCAFCFSICEFMEALFSWFLPSPLALTLFLFLLPHYSLSSEGRDLVVTSHLGQSFKVSFSLHNIWLWVSVLVPVC